MKFTLDSTRNFPENKSAIADNYLQPLKSASCGKSFNLADDMKRNELILRKEMPHICRLCAKKVTEAGTFMKHK